MHHSAIFLTLFQLWYCCWCIWQCPNKVIFLSFQNMHPCIISFFYTLQLQCIHMSMMRPLRRRSMKFFFFSILDVSNVIQICGNCFVLSSHLLFSLRACHTQCCLEYLMFFNELSMLPILSPSLFFYLPPLDYFLFPLLDYSSVK